MSSVHAKEGSNVSSNIITSDFSLVIKEYTGLINFVNKTPPLGNHQLSHFLFPFYVYIYLFLLKNQKFKDAQRFISTYSRLFLNTEGYAEVVQDLVNFQTLKDFQDHSYLRNFCENEYKYKVKLSEENMKLLKEYLEGTECVVLSYIFHRRFNVEVSENPRNHQSDIESTCIKKKESTSPRAESLKINSSKRSIDVEKVIDVIEDQCNHEHTTKISSIKKKEPIIPRTEISESNSATRSIDIKRANNVIKDQSNHKHSTEISPIKKNKSTSSKTKISKSNSIRNISVKKINIIEDQSNNERTTKASIEKKESTSQRTDISESKTPTGMIGVRKPNDGFSSKVSCYHYTISCRKEQLCCVDINQKNTLLACGFESSRIQIWNIGSDIVNVSSSKNLDSIESKCFATNSSDNNGSSPSLRCVLKGHIGAVYGLAYASGLLMSCSEDTTARAWSMSDFKNVRIYCDHKYPIWDIAVSSDCAYFATASLDCTACLWSFNRTTPLRIFVGHSSDVDHVRFHSNGRYLATASADKTIQLWAIEDGRSVRNFLGHNTHINSIAFSPDGKHIASADDSGNIKIWDLASGKLHNEIAAHSKKILSLSYNSDSSLIASCSIDSFIKIWDVKHSLPVDEEGKNEDQATLLVNSHSVYSMPHYVGFCQKEFLISVGAQMTTEN